MRDPHVERVGRHTRHPRALLPFIAGVDDGFGFEAIMRTSCATTVADDRDDLVAIMSRWI